MKYSIALLFAALAAAQSPTITVTGPAYVRPGAAVTLTASVSGASGSAAVQWFLPAISGVTYTATPGPAIPAGKSLYCGASPGLFGCIVAGGMNVLTDGILATITFTAPASGSYPFPVTNQLAATPAADPVVVAAAAPVTLAVLSPCDINGDGKVDSVDITLALQAAIARTINTALDLNGDGRVDVSDVQRVIVAAGGGACRAGGV